MQAGKPPDVLHGLQPRPAGDGTEDFLQTSHPEPGFLLGHAHNYHIKVFDCQGKFFVVQIQIYVLKVIVITSNGQGSILASEILSCSLSLVLEMS